MKIGKKFYYRASDRKLAVVLLAFVAICLMLIVHVGGSSEPNSTEMQHDSSTIRITNSPVQDKGNRRPTEYYAVEGRKAELFPFDPNTADSTALLRLGLQPWQVRNIYKYRAHGGVYRKPIDFAKLYGLTVKQYKALEPYIRIGAEYQPASTLVKEEEYVRDTSLYPIKLKENERISLNITDTTTLKRVPGIGSYFAHAIVRHGERLGGYVDIDQLDEIEGFPTEAKRYFEIHSMNTKRMNLNKLNLSELRRHPYIGYYRARAITEYRRLHGRINSLEDLRLNRDFTPEAIERLRPYVEY